MIYKRQQLVNEKKKIFLVVCHVSICGQYAAVADMNIVLEKANVPKPKAFKVDALKAFIKKHSLHESRYSLPSEMTMSEKWLKDNHPVWITKRDKKLKKIVPLCDKHLIEKYLYGEGLSTEITELLPSDKWKTKGVFYNALNRYISFGSTSNSLLPTKLKNNGTYYQLPEKPGPDNVKRGNGGVDNNESNSKTRGVTKQDITNIKKVAALFKQNNHDFSIPMAYEVFDRNFQRAQILRKIGEQEITIELPFEEKDTISQSQFTWHLKKVISRADLLKIKYGNISYEKDFKDRQGVAHDGVQYAADVYEVDATQLDCYVRYPYDTTKQLSSGRPWLYIVIDVYSTMVVGMYIGFDGPNVNGAQQALANACLDKVEFAARYGLAITPNCIPAKHPPRRVAIDNGKEYPNGFISGILNSSLGIETFDILPAYRGDGKGTNEGFFNVINKKVIHFLKGAIHKNMGREQQHPSNYTLYDYDALVALVLNQIIVLNTASERMNKLNFQMVRDNIEPTPQAIFLNSLKYDRDGGRPTTKDDEAEVRWAFLPEEEATIRPDAIYFKGLKYQSEYAQKNGWHTTANFHGAEKIPVKRIRDWANTLWHKTPTGEYIEFTLANTNNESPYLDGHWEWIEQLQSDLRARRHKLKQDSRHIRALADTRFRHIHETNVEEVNLSPDNEIKSIQRGIKERFERNKRILAADEALELSELFMQQNKQAIADQSYIADADDDIY
jgi:putative transposase